MVLLVVVVAVVLCVRVCVRVRACVCVCLPACLPLMSQHEKLLPVSGSPWLASSHSPIRAFLGGPVTLSVLSAQVAESGRLGEAIDHHARRFFSLFSASSPAKPPAARARGTLHTHQLRPHTERPMGGPQYAYIYGAFLCVCGSS